MSTALATLSNTLAERFGMGADGDVVGVLKATAFRGPATDAQLTALLVVAQQYGLNPFTKEIYAFPDKNNGIVPVVGVDGWARIINSHPQFDGMDFEQDADSCTCILHRKDRGHPTRVTEYMIECKREGVGPWKSHPYRMLRHKALIQCARLAFGFVGIFDQDEAERIAEGEFAQQKASKTPQGAAAQNAPDELQAFEEQHLGGMQDAAKNGVDCLQAAFNSIAATKIRTAFWTKHGAALKASAAQAEVFDADTGEVTQ
jgi:phage recombination protein Bet